jgi:transcriptional regulator with XRE-family HTH domain
MSISRERVLKEFGRALASLRQEANMSQEELAARSGLHRTYIGGLERAERNPTVMTLMALANGLDVLPSELLRKASL